MSLMELQNASYCYQNGRMVLERVNAGFDAGKMYVIFGPSGCGKTTLLSLLGGLDIPTGGRVLYKEEEIRKRDLELHRKNHVSFIFQNYNLIDYMTAVENAMLTARTDPLPILKRLGLSEEEIHRNVQKLSGGQQQRVAIARALASGSPVILADEPTGNLDEETAGEITEILKESAGVYGKCVIVVSHSQAVADQADVVYELRGGGLSSRAGMRN